MKILGFERTTNAFNYVFDYDLKPNETIIVKMPVVSSNKRGVNDIGWQADGDVKLYGTICFDPKKTTTLWDKIENNSDINKTVNAIKIVNGMHPTRIVMRAILN